MLVLILWAEKELREGRTLPDSHPVAHALDSLVGAQEQMCVEPQHGVHSCAWGCINDYESCKDEPPVCLEARGRCLRSCRDAQPAPSTSHQ